MLVLGARALTARLALGALLHCRPCVGGAGGCGCHQELCDHRAALRCGAPPGAPGLLTLCTLCSPPLLTATTASEPWESTDPRPSMGPEQGKCCWAEPAVPAVCAAPAAQFNDRPILEYITHQRRLMPGLATAYAMHLALQHVKVRYWCPFSVMLAVRCRSYVGRISRAQAREQQWQPTLVGQGVTAVAGGLALRRACCTSLPCYLQRLGLQGGAESAKRLHVMSSGFKAAATWNRQAIQQDCRECCGGGHVWHVVVGTRGSCCWQGRHRRRGAAELAHRTCCLYPAGVLQAWGSWRPTRSGPP